MFSKSKQQTLSSDFLHLYHRQSDVAPNECWMEIGTMCSQGHGTTWRTEISAPYGTYSHRVAEFIHFKCMCTLKLLETISFEDNVFKNFSQSSVLLTHKKKTQRRKLQICPNWFTVLTARIHRTWARLNRRTSERPPSFWSPPFPFPAPLACASVLCLFITNLMWKSNFPSFPKSTCPSRVWPLGFCTDVFAKLEENNSVFLMTYWS